MIRDRRFDTPENALGVVRSHENTIITLRNRLRHVEKQLDTLGTPWWKRVLFRIDGWPPWYIVADKPAWRPWRRWWRS